MRKAGIRFKKADNCFTHISDFEAAEKLAGEFDPARVHDKDHSHRGINFFREEDGAFMQALQRGEQCIRGLRNRGMQQHQPDWSAAKIGRALRRFRAHGLLNKVAGTHKYSLTRTGSSSLNAATQIKERLVLPALAA